MKNKYIFSFEAKNEFSLFSVNILLVKLVGNYLITNDIFI